MLLDVSKILESVSEHKNHEWEKLEKILLTVVSGTLALSVTFFSRQSGFLYPIWLKASWALLSVSLFFLLGSYIFTDWQSLRIIRSLQPRRGGQVELFEYDKIVNCWQKQTAEISNYISVISAGLGLAALTLFGFLNI